jgi:hypothetical protein
MKLLKWFFILFAVCVLIVVAGVLILLNSAGLQKSIVQGQLEKHVTVEEFDTFKAGFSSVTIEKLAIEKDGMIVGLDALTLKYSLWDYVFGKEVRVEDLTVSGLVVNTRGPSIPMGPGPVIPQASGPSEVSPGTVAEKRAEAQQAEAKQAKREKAEPVELEPFKGIFAHGALPFKLYVGSVNIEAQALLPNAQTVNATVTGGGIEPGTSGALNVDVAFEDGTPAAQLQRGELTGKLTLTQNEDAALTRILLEIEVAGDGTAVPDAPKLALTADLAQQADKTETYKITMAEAAQPDARLVNLDATFEPSGNQLKGTLTLAANDGQVAALVPQEKLPVFTLDGNLDFDLATTSGDGTVQGKFRLVLDQLARLRAELAGLGQVTLTADLEAAGADQVVTLQRAEAGLASANQGQLLVLEMLKPLSVKCSEDAEMPELTGELVRLTLNALPLSLVDPWLKGIQLSGQPLSAQVVVSGEGDGAYHIALPQGLTVADLSVTKDGQPLLDTLTIAVQPDVVYSPEKATVALTGLKLSQRGVPFAQGDVHIKADPSADDPEASLQTTLSGDLAQLLKQPALVRFNNVATGTFEVTAQAELDEGKGTFDANVALKNLLVREPMKQVSQLKLDAKGSFEGASKLELTAPLVLKTAEGDTDLTLKAELEKQGAVQNFDVTLTGSQLDLDGVQLLAAAFKNPTAAATAPPPAASAPATTATRPASTTQSASRTGTASAAATSSAAAQADTVPFWNGFAGKASAQIGKIYAQKYRLDDASLQLTLTQDRLTVDPLAATFAGAPLKADTLITFTPGASPYDLKSNLSFSQFDVGKFLVQEAPGTTPPLTGMFDVTGTATGTGPTMPALMQKVQGKFNLTGTSGSLRVLAAAGQEGAGSALSLGLGIASMFQKNQRTGVQTAQKLIQVLQQIDYDRFAIVADRGQNLDINLSELALTGPQIRMNGTGKVTYAAGTPIPQQTLSGQVNLAAKDDVARLFSDLRMLSASTPDADGFYEAFSFPLKGTLAKPDFSELNQKLLSAAAATATGSSEGRMEKNTGTATDGTAAGETTEGETAPAQQENSNDAARNAVQGLLNSLLNNK